MANSIGSSQSCKNYEINYDEVGLIRLWFLFTLNDYLNTRKKNFFRSLC